MKDALRNFSGVRLKGGTTLARENSRIVIGPWEHFPQFAPNPNTGEPFGSSARWQVAQQTVLHDAAHASAIILPVIPAGAGGPALTAVPSD